MRALFATALLLAGCGTAPATPTDGLAKAVAANARQLFAHYDLDHDGALSPGEALGVAIDGPTFTALDGNRDGKLSWAEFAPPGRMSGLAERFRQVAMDLIKDEDQDGDGRLSRPEYRTGMLVPWPGPLVASPLTDPLEASFARADRDGDGFLTATEAQDLVGFLLDSGYHLQQRTQ